MARRADAPEAGALTRAGVCTVVAAGLALAACGPQYVAGTLGTTATAELRSTDGRVIGTAVLTEVPGGVRILLEMREVAAGPKAVHIHEVGQCEPPTFTSAGDHFNPAKRQHGLLNPYGPHAGDLPNITIAPDGSGRLETMSERITLSLEPNSILDADGSAFVVHSAPDDFKTDPTGNSGARIACGVIVKRPS